MIEMTEEDENVLKKILSTFTCNRDKDIDYFLHEKSIEFEKLGKARTYLICNQEQLDKKDFCLDQLLICGYITLALKVLSVPPETSINTRKKLDGLSGKIHGKAIENFPCYLIGQLARNDSVTKKMLPGEELLRFSYDIIATVVEAIGGRYIMIECRDEEGLLSFYSQNDFKRMSESSDGDYLQIQMIRKI